MSKNLIWGIGDYYNKYRDKIQALDVVALVDSNIKKQGLMIDNIQVIAPEMVQKVEYDRIYIMSTAINAIKKQIMELGISKEKICYFFDLEQNVVAPKHLDEREKGEKKVAMISHDFSITGAQNCLLQMATYLVKKGWHVKVGSPYEGELNSHFKEVGADSFVDERLRMGTIENIEWINECDLLIVNTVQMYYLLRKRDLTIPLVWWLHEPAILYKSVVPEIINSLPTENMRVYTVSKVADEAFHELCKSIKTEPLMFGVEDCGKTVNKNVHERVRFIIIGQVSKIKGHDVLMEAIRLLSDEVRKECEFVLVGDNSSGFAKSILSELERIGVKYVSTGAISHEKTMDEISGSDVLICTSRTETVSMAVVEAMMRGTPTIVSDAAGVVEYLEDGKSSYLWKSENPEALCEKIRWVLENRDEIKKVGLEGRAIFTEVFELSKFEERMKTVFSEMVF